LPLAATHLAGKPACIVFTRSASGDRDQDLRDAILRLIFENGDKLPGPMTDQKLTVTRFGRTGPRSRDVDPSDRIWTEEFFGVQFDPAWDLRTPLVDWRVYKLARVMSAWHSRAARRGDESGLIFSLFR
jgi:hypothetical protein